MADLHAEMKRLRFSSRIVLQTFFPKRPSPTFVPWDLGDLDAEIELYVPSPALVSNDAMICYRSRFSS